MEAIAASALSHELCSALISLVGEKGCLFDPQETAAYCEDWRQLYKGKTLAVVRPASTEEVASVVRFCAESRIAVVPQGGNTGMMGGAAPHESGTEIVVSLSRMNRIRAVDAIDLTMTVEAGVVLKAAQDAAVAHDCMLPLAMGSEGTAQIGGVISTNAGGNNTVRYGNARDLLLGLEVVLPDGRIWNGLRRLRKDNTGYCLRQLFAGAEGTLGIVTAAVLRLLPRPQEVALAFCAVPSLQSALDLLVLFRRYQPDSIQAFEYICGELPDLILKHFPDTRFPLSQRADHYVLVELAAGAPDGGLREKLEDILGKAMDVGIVIDAALAGSSSERLAVWQMREEASDAQKREAPTIKNDVSVPVSKTVEFITEAKEACQRKFPGIRVLPYGHLGDGNIHFHLLPAEGTDSANFMDHDHAIMDIVNEVVRRYDGSFSAEHGVGRLKTYMMERWRGGVELDTMRAIKAALDPQGIMNPGKVLTGCG
jgi:FAD/FMN-containing dehydrogenase